jgi:hypothetical protein
MSLLQQLAREVFISGRSLNSLIDDLVRDEESAAIAKSKRLFRLGNTEDQVNAVLVSEGVPFSKALTLTQIALTSYQKELKAEEINAKSIELAIRLFKNGNRFSDVVTALRAEGCSGDQAERIATQYQHGG